MRRLSLVASAMALSLTLVACGGTTNNNPPAGDCDYACAAVYVSCQLTLVDGNGYPMSEGQCIDTCEALNFGDMEACVNAAQCDAGAVVACFQP